MMKSNNKSIAIAMTIASFSIIATGCGAAPQAAPIALAPVAAPIPAGIAQVGIPGGGQCIPLNQPIGFQADGLFNDGIQTVVAGSIPWVDKFAPNRQMGTVRHMVGGVVAPAAGVRTIQTMPNRPDGSFMMNINTLGALSGRPGYGSGTGVFTISPIKLSIIYGLFGINYPNVTTPFNGSIPQAGFPSLATPFYSPNMTATQMQAQVPCVSSVAISLSYAGLVNNAISGGRVYLYLNNLGRGDYLQF
jgi:hypothetical protein